MGKDSNSGKPTNPLPMWLRVVLTGLVILFMCFAFYVNNLRIIEYFEQ